MSEIENKILKFCNDPRHGKRIVGMRYARGKCMVRYIDAMGSVFNDDDTVNHLCLFIGPTWADVLEQIEKAG